MRKTKVAHITLDQSKISSSLIKQAKRYSASKEYFWLKSNYQANQWKVIDDIKFPDTNEPEITYCNVDFTYPIFSDGSKLTDSRNEQWNQLVRACLCYYRSGVGNLSTTLGQTMISTKNHLFFCIDYFKLNGYNQIGQLTPSFLERFIFDFIPYGASYFLNWRERFLVQLKANPNALTQEGKFRLNLSCILDEALIPRVFSSDAFYIHMRSELYRRSETHSDRNLTQTIPLEMLIPTHTMSVGGIKGYTYALSLMHDVTAFVDGTGIETMPFNPVGQINIEDLSNKSKTKTRTIVPQLALKLISESITYIDSYANGLVESYEYLITKTTKNLHSEETLNEFFCKYKTRRGPDSKKPLIIPEGIHSAVASHYTLHHAIFSELVSACAIIIFAFSARREVEVYDLRSNCKDYKELLRIYIAKTDRAYDLTPKVEVVDKALDILIRLSAHNRKANQTTHIFEFTSLVTFKSIKWSNRANEKINRFAQKVNCHLDDEGISWKYSEHQFRRFFAIMFYWQSDNKNLEALSYCLRHFSLAMTRQYIEKSIAGDIVRDVAKMRTKSLIYNVGTNDSPMGRLFSKRLKAYKRYVLIQLNIISIEQATKSLQRQFNEQLEVMVDQSIEHMCMLPEVKPWGECFGGTKGRQIRAKCVPASDKKKLEIFRSRASSASCEECMACSNLYTDKNNLAFIEIQQNEDQQILNSLNKQKNVNASLVAFVERRRDLLHAARERIVSENGQPNR